jgi:hypothetical protein
MQMQWLPLLVWLWHQFDTFSEVVPREGFIIVAVQAQCAKIMTMSPRHAGRARKAYNQGLGFIPQFAARQAQQQLLTLDKKSDHYVRVDPLLYTRTIKPYYYESTYKCARAAEALRKYIHPIVNFSVHTRRLGRPVSIEPKLYRNNADMRQAVHTSKIYGASSLRLRQLLLPRWLLPRTVRSSRPSSAVFTCFPIANLMMVELH